MAKPGHDSEAGHPGPARDEFGELLTPAALWLGGGRFDRLAESAPSMRRTLLRLVLPMALIAPVMILFAVHDHPAAYGLDGRSAKWEWFVMLVLILELASVRLMAAVLRGAVSRDGPVPSHEQAYLAAGIAAAPLWGSAAVLVVPNLAALVAAHLLGQIFSVRALYRATRALLPGRDEAEVLYLVQMTYSAALVPWVLLFALSLLGLHQP